MQSSLSEAECKEIAEKSFGKDVFVVDHVIKAIGGEKMGFLGDYFLLDLKVKDEQNNLDQRNYFIKAPAPLNESQEDESREFLAKEAMLYSSILNDFSKYSKTKWKPDVYLTRDDILVLENLKLLGYEPIPKNTEVNIDHMKLILSNLAAMHACSFAYERDVGETIGSKYGSKLFETSILKDFDWFRVGVNGLQEILRVHPKYQSEQHQQFIETKFHASIDPAYEMVNQSNRFRNVLCHRDTWQNNVLFLFTDKYYEKPIKSVLVDFQFCRYCPPAIDVLLAIYFNITRSMRLKILSECLQWYYQELAKELESLDMHISELMSWESFLKSCQQLEMVISLYNGVVATMMKLPDGFLQKLRISDPQKFAKYRTESRKDILLHFIDNDEQFREFMFDAVEDLMNIIYKRE